jgi:hypothetical protein
MKRNDSEHRLQSACVMWCDSLAPSAIRPLTSRIFAIPNGGQRNVVVATKLKREGVRAGVPDLFLPIMRSGHGGLFIELKNGKAGRVSESQAERIEQLGSSGYAVSVARSIEEFIETVTTYLKGN